MRVRQRQVAELALEVRELERRHVDVAAVERHVAHLHRQDRVVRVDDRADAHERDRRLGVRLQARLPLRELDVVLGRAEDAAATRLICDASMSVAPLTAPRPVTANCDAYVPEKPAFEFQ